MASLSVCEWHNAYRVPAGTRLRPGLDSDLDRLAPRLAESLAGVAEALLGEGSQVVLVPELEFDCTLDVSCPEDNLLRHWSAGLAQSLARVLADPASGVVRFPNTAAFQAAFVADLVRGLAWGRWWYRRFAGLRHLPAGAAIRTLVTADAGVGLATLARIDDGLWPALAQTLGSREAVRILSAWQDAVPGSAHCDSGPEPHPDSAPSTGQLPSCPALAPPLLALYLLSRWRSGGAPPCKEIGLACWVAALLALAPGTGVETLLRRAGSGEPGALPPLLRGQDQDWVELLSLAPTESRLAATRLIARSRPSAGPNGGIGDAWAILPTPLGGMVWLLPALKDLLLARPRGAASLAPSLAQALPGPPPGSGWEAADAAARLTLAILAGDAGPDLMHDPFWCAFLGLPTGLDPQGLAAWLGDRDPAGAGSALAAALRHLALGEPVLLRPPGASGMRGRALLAERGTACPLHPGCWTPEAGDDAGPDPAPVPWRERLALTRALGGDLRAIAASPILGALPVQWREAFAGLAQGTLRRTANRIPGSALGSPRYLRANILGVGGEARAVGRGHWTLELARPPLHVLLALNGMARLRLDWPGGREIAVQSGG